MRRRAAKVRGFASFRGIAAGLVLTFASGVAAQEIPARKPRPPKDFSISLNVDLVVLHVAVKDRRGRLVGALEKEHFRVYEDGRPQEIRFFRSEDVPVTLGLVVDNSASMIPKRADVIGAALALAEARNPRDEIFVVHFNEQAVLGLPPGVPFTSDLGQVSAALQARMPEGRTALYDALALALDHLERGKTDKRALVVISDGGDNASRLDFKSILRKAQKSNVIIYTIGLFDETDTDREPSVLRRLAKVTGGEIFLPRSVQGASNICRRIAEDMRAQYSLGYVPPPVREGEGYRTIEVKAWLPGRDRLRCRTRPGYFASRGRSEAAENRPEEIP